MNDKKIRLIEAGIKLFAEKGYHMTSVEEIAVAAGVSKGAFYLHFKSKSDFILTAIQYYHQEMTERIESVRKKDLKPRESFARQIEVLTASIYQYKDFLTMHLYQNISIGENNDQFIKHMNTQNFFWLRQNIMAIYGDQLTSYYSDLIIQLEGLINGYLKSIIIDGVKINGNHLGHYIVRRMDDIVHGLRHREEPPLVTSAHIPEASQAEVPVSKILIDMKNKLSMMELTADKVAELEEVITILLNEAVREDPQKTMIQGLLVHFQRIPEFEQDCQKLAKLFQIDLLT